MSKRLKIILAIAVVLIVALVAAKKQGWIGGEEITAVKLSEVVLRDLEETVIASGKIQPEVEVMLSSEVSGEIIELPINEGDQVRKGDLLIRINPDIYQSAVNRALAALNSSKAAVSSAKAQLKEIESSFKRSQKLYTQKVISDAEFEAAQRGFDVAELNVQSAQYQLASAQATYREANDNLARTTIYAPHDGTISRLNSEVGERVVGTAQMAGTEIARLANLQNMEVLVEVNENDIVRVNVGDTALIEVDAYLDEEFKGIVTEIANSARLQGVSSDQVTNFEVKVRMVKSSYGELVKDSTESPFRPGMTASVEIKTARKSQVLSLPIEAVTTRTDTSSQAKSYRMRKASTSTNDIFEVVFVYHNGKAVLKVVETGIQDDEFIEIVEGVVEGDEVISGPYSLVSKELINGDVVEKEKEGRKSKSEQSKE